MPLAMWKKPVDVSFGREVLETLPYKRKIVEEPSLSGKKVVVKQHGIKGYKVKRSRLLKYADGKTKRSFSGLCRRVVALFLHRLEPAVQVQHHHDEDDQNQQPDDARAPAVHRPKLPACAAAHSIA